MGNFSNYLLAVRSYFDPIGSAIYNLLPFLKHVISLQQLLLVLRAVTETQLFHSRETKIVLKGKNASHLCELKSKADALGLPTFCVHDAGRTEVIFVEAFKIHNKTAADVSLIVFEKVTPGSLTVLAIMGQNDVINKVTGSLSLL